MTTQKINSKKIAIITGATGNLGLAVTVKLLAGGYHVTGTIGITDNVNLYGTNSMLVLKKVDLTNELQSGKFIEEVIKNEGHIDTVVLTVGGFTLGNIGETSFSDIAKQIELNFATAYNIAKPVLKQMLKQNSGRIFLVGSKPGLAATDAQGMTAYGMSKSLVFRLAELMNEESKGKNVFTIVIVPGTIDTPQNRLEMPGADFSNWVKPESIANIISFYCSGQAQQLREPVIRIYGSV